jgi:hypothetical protein
MMVRLLDRIGTISSASTRRLHRLATCTGDSGMSTAEYAVGTIAAVAFAAVLYGVVTGTPVVSGLSSLVSRALSVKF